MIVDENPAWTLPWAKAIQEAAVLSMIRNKPVTLVIPASDDGAAEIRHILPVPPWSRASNDLTMP